MIKVAIDLDGAPLKTTLRLLLKQLGLSYVVEDGFLFISSQSGVDREKNDKLVAAPDDSANTKAVVALLDNSYSMPFPAETPLRDVLKYIQRPGMHEVSGEVRPSTWTRLAPGKPARPAPRPSP